MPAPNYETKYIGVIDTMCGIAVAGETLENDVYQVSLYDSEQDWRDEMVDLLEMQIEQVKNGERDPFEVGIEEECVEVRVFPDGRVMSPDMVIDYRSHLS